MNLLQIKPPSRAEFSNSKIFFSKVCACNHKWSGHIIKVDTDTSKIISTCKTCDCDELVDG